MVILFLDFGIHLNVYCQVHQSFEAFEGLGRGGGGRQWERKGEEGKKYVSQWLPKSRIVMTNPV
jgi:hypothetical protein